MKMTPLKCLAKCIAELRTLEVQKHDNLTNIDRVSTILKRWIIRKDWLEEKYYHYDAAVGFSSWLLHEEPDHTLAVNLVAWQPGREIVPHDHKTWAVVGNVVGIEKNNFWKRIDDGSKIGYAEIEKEKEVIVPAGELITFLPNDIHSVINLSDGVAISLHVYGKNLNYTNRFQYDPDNKTAKPFIVNFN